MFNDWVMARWWAKHPGPNKVGDRVRFRFGLTDVDGVIVEDRGNLGGGGKRLYGITFQFGESPDKYIELAPDDYEVIAEVPMPDESGTK
jgi:hypothetical protein